MSASLYTRDQLNRLLVGWNQPDAKPPTKGKALWIVFPNQTSCKITKSPHKSTDKKTLFLVDWDAGKVVA
jgi:hypothetical protein